MLLQLYIHSRTGICVILKIPPYLLTTVCTRIIYVCHVYHRQYVATNGMIPVSYGSCHIILLYLFSPGDRKHDWTSPGVLAFSHRVTYSTSRPHPSAYDYCTEKDKYVATYHYYYLYYSLLSSLHINNIFFAFHFPLGTP